MRKEKSQANTVVQDSFSPDILSGPRHGDARANMTRPAIRYLTLWLTTSCNLDCVYCYRGKQHPLAMPFSVALAALNQAGASGLPFHLQLAGGEPTLEPELIQRIAQTVHAAGWKATIALQTNGTLLGENLIDLCLRHGIALGVSLDGPPEVQERTRGGAKAVFRGLELLAKARVRVHITTVMSGANTACLGDLVLCLAGFPNIEGIGLDPLVNKGMALLRGVKPPSDPEISRGIRDMLTTLERVNRSRACPIRWRERDAVTKSLSRDRPPPAYCHACQGESLAVHPDGRVFPCGQTVGDPSMAAGLVDDIDWEKLRSFFRGAHLQGECESCVLNGKCPGDCPSRLAYNTGLSAGLMCMVYRTIAESPPQQESL